MKDKAALSRCSIMILTEQVQSRISTQERTRYFSTDEVPYVIRLSRDRTSVWSPIRTLLISNVTATKGGGPYDGTINCSADPNGLVNAERLSVHDSSHGWKTGGPCIRNVLPLVLTNKVQLNSTRTLEALAGFWGTADLFTPKFKRYILPTVLKRNVSVRWWELVVV